MSYEDILRSEPYLKIRQRNTQLKMENAQLQTRLAEAEKDRDSVRGEIESVKTKYDESKLKTEVGELRGQLRSLSHRRTFDRLAEDRHVAKDSLDLVWQASGWKAEEDDVDEAAMGTLLDELKTRPGVARLFGEAAEARLQTPTATPAPGRGQGGRDAANGRFRVTRAQMRDPDWCRDNDARRAEAIQNGTLDIVD